MHKSPRVSLLSLVVFFALRAFALPEFIPPQERAQGHSLAGAVQFNDSLYSNPAASAFTQVYSVEGSLAKNVLAASVIDTKTSYVGGSLGYLRREDSETGEKLEALRLGVCRKINDALAIGVMGKTLWNSTQRMNDSDVGILAKLTPIELGFVARNLLGGARDLENQQREYALGARLGFKDTLYFSASTQATDRTVFAPYEYGIGAEFVSPYFFSIKGGHRWKMDTGERLWSTGVSLLSPRLLAHYSVEFSPIAGGTSNHQVAVSLLF